MTLLVFSAVIFAAALHATWNAMIKSQHDKLLSMTAMVVGCGFIALIILPFVGLPHEDSYIYLAFAIVVHTGYHIFLASAYKHGDLSLVYPISRGTAPLIVTIFSIVILGIQFEILTLFGLGLIVFAILCLIFSGNHTNKGNGKAIILALVTACFIASYSIIDGFGARAAGSSLSFYALLSVINGIVFTVFIGIKSPHYLSEIFRGQKFIMTFGGVASFSGFAIILWAFTQSTIATVVALREVSIIFAMLIGVVIFKEKFGYLKAIACVATLGGMVLLRIS